MLQVRVIPALLLKGKGLVKTIKFKDSTYLGDPINAVKIYNEKEVDELVFLDITATKEKRKPSPAYITQIANECFMPFGYGGGITSLDEVKEIIKAGAEKVVLNSSAVTNPKLVRESADMIGSSSVVVSIDAKKKLFGKYEVFTESGTKASGLEPVLHAKNMEKFGAGELIINSIDKDGTMEGFDLELVKQVSEAVSIPVIACGGAGKLSDFSEAVKIGKASAVAAGSMFVFHGKKRAVLINYPTRNELENLFSPK